MAALIGSLSCCSSALAQARHDLTVAPLFGQTYPAGRLLPLRVELRNNGAAAVDGAVLVIAGSLPAAMNIRVPVHVPPRAHVVLTAYAPLPAEPLSRQGVAATGTDVVPVAIAEWRGADGARLARGEVLARPMPAGANESHGFTSGSGWLLLAVHGSDRERVGESFLVREFAAFIARQVPYPVEMGTADAAELPRHVAGYDAVRAVILDALPRESLDELQRAALLEYLNGGGTLVLPAPADDLAGTWLSRYAPVHVVGRRVASEILPRETAGGAPAPPLKFRTPVVISEALDAGADTLLLRDGAYVHAAIRRVGLGRVVFTSFPINALDASDDRAEELWRTLLDLDRAAPGGDALASERDRLLETMIGAPAAPWSHAAAVAGGYLLLLVAAQLMFRGARRPTAFLVTTAAAGVTCLALLGARALFRDDGAALVGARLATVDLGADGAGVRHESWALLGGAGSPVSLSVDLRATLRAATADAHDPPTLNQLPFAAPDAGVRGGHLERVWQASEPVAAGSGVRATAQFVPQGVRVEFENHTGELAAPLLAWNGNYYRLPTVPSGPSASLLGAKNPPGDFTNVALITGEEATLRGRIVQASGTGRATQAPALFAWVDPASTRFGQPIVQFSTEPQSVRAQVLLSADVRVLPSPPGATISIPPDLVTFGGGAGAGVFFDPERREWLRSLQTGAWTLRFAPPPGIGTLKPLRATIFADLAAPGHTIVLRRGQCRYGTMVENPDGPIAAEWQSVTGMRTVSVDLDANDVDASGALWLRLAVDVTDFGAGGAIPQWKFNDLSVGLDMRVDGGGEPGPLR